MNEFNDWWQKQNPDYKQVPNLQFTELTPDDIATHEDLYIDILPKGGFMSKQWHAQLYDYNFKELLKSKQTFHKTFK